MTEMVILVSGIKGFIASRLMDAWKSSPHTLIGLVRKTDGAISFPTIVSDLSCESPCIGAVDVIVHIAATSPGFFGNPENLIRDNVLGTLNLAMSAMRSGVEKFIHFSSLSVYDAIQEERIDQQTLSLTYGVYGLSKLMSESIVKEYGPPQAIMLRLPAILGAGAQYPWIMQTVHQLLTHQPVRIYNPDKLYNAMLHVSNLSDFVSHLWGHQWEGKPAIPLGCSDPMTVLEIVEFLKRHLESTSFILIEKEVSRVPLINLRMAEDFGFTPFSAEKTLTCLVDDLVNNNESKLSALS